MLTELDAKFVSLSHTLLLLDLWAVESGPPMGGWLATTDHSAQDLAGSGSNAGRGARDARGTGISTICIVHI